jgi:FtsP/CotA-like multicopper oxidase with cupredoxin domain
MSLSGARGQTPAPSATAPEGWRVLTAAPKRAKLYPDAKSEAELWAFDGQVPGPVLRVRHGDEFRLRFQNRIDRPLSLHWYGVRNANAQDGVGGLTQARSRPDRTFEYRFTPPDAGTFMVRPLVIGASAEATERGLSAILVVEEREPPKIDQDFALLVDDWRLNEDGSLAPFGNALEAATGGGSATGLRSTPGRARAHRGRARLAHPAAAGERLQRPLDPHPLRRPQGLGNRIDGQPDRHLRAAALDPPVLARQSLRRADRRAGGGRPEGAGDGAAGQGLALVTVAGEARR